MTTFVVVETQDLVDAARTLTLEVGDPVADAGLALADVLAGCGAMAGDDPGGLSWAEAYDRAAAPAARAVLDVANGCYRLAQLCGQTARNYDLADAASAAGSRSARDTAVASLPGVKEVDVSSGPPGAAGGSGDTPTGWSLIENRVGYVWPNGHQDRLRHAGTAWQHAGAVLENRAWQATLASIRLAADRLPEYDDVHAMCAAMTSRMTRLAGACQTIGRACADLAQHLDTVHAEVRSELVQLGAESIGIQVLGAALSAVTVGAAEAPTQAAQLAKIIAVAAAVASKIEKFVALARAAAAQVAVVVADAARLAAELRTVRDLRIVAVSVHGVGAFPAIVRVREGASIMRMEGAAASAPDAMVAVARGRAFVLRHGQEDSALSKIPTDKRWGTSRTLAKHLDKHGARLGTKTQSDYVRKASAFFQYALNKHLPMKLDEEGTVRIWDPEAKIFAAYDRDGMCVTIYREPRPDYLDRQPGIGLW